MNLILTWTKSGQNGLTSLDYTILYWPFFCACFLSMRMKAFIILPLQTAPTMNLQKNVLRFYDPKSVLWVFLSTSTFVIVSLGTLTNPNSLLCKFLESNLSSDISKTFVSKRFPNGSTTVKTPSRTLKSVNFNLSCAPMNFSGFISFVTVNASNYHLRPKVRFEWKI